MPKREKSVQIFTPYERLFSLVFWQKERSVGGDPFYLKFWVNRPHWSQIANFEPILARSASAVTPSEKSLVNTNRKSTTRFPMTLRWPSYMLPLSPQRWAQKHKTAVFRLKSHFAWRKSATKFLCVKTVSDKVVSIFARSISDVTRSDKKLN